MLSRRDFLRTAAAAPALVSAAAPSQQPDDFASLVNPFVGTGGHGHTTPAATVPFGMVQFGPDTDNVGWDRCSGYGISDTSLMGFSHTHLSGTGIGDMLDILLVPRIGSVTLAPGSPDRIEGSYRSAFSHAEERAEPGYYSVVLRDSKIRAELTATERAALGRFTYPRSDSAHFVVDLVHGIQSSHERWPDIIEADLTVSGTDTLTGGRRLNAWARNRHIYFAMRFSKPFEQAQLYVDDKPQNSKHVTGLYLKAALHFRTGDREVVFVKTGLSAVSVEGALRNLEREVPDWGFERVRVAARERWNRELSRVKVECDDKEQKTIFYSSLYHCFAAPTLFDDADGRYRGMDGQIHSLPAGQHNYSTYSLWDTYRALHPLFTLAQADRVPDFVNCLARMAAESPAGAPVWPLAGSETGCMTGYHSAVVIAEACAKGFGGIDYRTAYQCLRKRAMQDDYRGLGFYRKLGYVPCDQVEESATKTIEYAVDDWAVAHIARHVGEEADYQLLRKRSLQYRNLFDKESGFIRPKLADGSWASHFDPKQTGTSAKWRDFTESNSWQATWGAQHDAGGYAELLGGSKAFAAKLDALFAQSPQVDGEVPADMTGLVGMYAHGNEPSHHIAYLYAYAGMPHKTQARVADLLRTQYRHAPDGLAGNEDCGQMSAWYVMSALGFYAVDPVSAAYVIGLPQFDRAVLQLAGGRTLTIEAQGRSKAKQADYIRAAMFKGKPLDRLWFRHADLLAGDKGAVLSFEMSSEPNLTLGTASPSLPPSLSSGEV